MIAADAKLPNCDVMTFVEFAIFCGSRAKTPKQLHRFTSRLATSGKIRVFEISSRMKRISLLEALKFRESRTTPEKTTRRRK